MWLGFMLWFVTRGIIAFIVILIAGIYATLTNNVPLVLNDILLWCLRVYGLPDSNQGKLPEGTRIAVFDHPTFFDHSVLMQYFGRPLRFLTKMSHLSTWPLNALARSFKCVPASYNSLKEEISFDPIFVAPDPKFSRKPFKTGAFRASNVVTPIVIHYEPTLTHTDTLSYTVALYLSKFGCPTFYTSRVMSPIERDKDETVEDYASRVQIAMDFEREIVRAGLVVSKKKDRYWTSEYSGSFVLTLSSFICFFIPAIFGFSGLWSRVGMVLQGIASILYHSTGNHCAFWWDTWLRNLLGPSFILLDICIHGNWWPLAFGIFAVLHYTSGVFTVFEHALLVHFPVMIGFFLLNGL